MSRFLAVVYGLVAYVLFLATFLYAIGFVGNFVVPKTIDSGQDTPLAAAIIINLILLGVFAIQHSLMARPFFKRWWTKLVPEHVERTTYVFLASLALVLLYWQWRPITSPVWNVAGPAATALSVIFWLGWLTVLLSTFMISHWELFGLTQVWLNFREREAAKPQFATPFFYGFVRHPIYLGFILAFWAAPKMTGGHLLFALMTTAYILIAIQLEEHDLIATYGEAYVSYRRRVAMLIPMRSRTR